MHDTQVSLGLIQSRCSESLEENTAKAISGIREAAGRGAQIVCTQELFRSRYFCQVEDPRFFELAERIPGPTCEQLQAEAASLGLVIIGSLFEERAPGLYHNTAVVIDADGTLLGSYRKMHIPDDPGFYEKYYFAPGDQGFRVWQTRYGRIGVLICWDQWFPEAARLTALQGAELLVYPTAIGWLPSEKATVGREQFEAWQTVQRSHAIANGCYVAAINRVGTEQSRDGDGIEFWGGSFVAGTMGNLICQGSHEDEEVVVAEIDLSRIASTRRSWPFLRDRRIDAYQDLNRRFCD